MPGLTRFQDYFRTNPLPPPQIPVLRRSHIIGLAYSQQLALFSPQSNRYVDFLQRFQFQGSILSHVRWSMTRHILTTMRQYSIETFQKVFHWCELEGVTESCQDFQAILQITSVSLTLIMTRVLYDLSLPNVDFYLPPVWYQLPQCSTPSFDHLTDYMNQSKLTPETTPTPQPVELPNTTISTINTSSCDRQPQTTITKLLNSTLDQFPIVTSLYSLINQLSPAAWVMPPEHILPLKHQHICAQLIAGHIIPHHSQNIISPNIQFSQIAPTPPLTTPISIADLIPVPKLPIQELQTLPPPPPFLVFNQSTNICALTNYPTYLSHQTLYLRDAVFAHGKHTLAQYTTTCTNHPLPSEFSQYQEQHLPSPLHLTELISRRFSINQFYTYYLGLGEILTPIETNSFVNGGIVTGLKFNPQFVSLCQKKNLPPQSPIPPPVFPIIFSNPLYFTLLPSNIRYQVIIIAHARMGLLESTHFKFDVPSGTTDSTTSETQSNTNGDQLNMKSINLLDWNPIPLRNHRFQVPNINNIDTLNLNSGNNSDSSDNNRNTNNIDDGIRTITSYEPSQSTNLLPNLSENFFKSVSNTAPNWRMFQKSGSNAGTVNFVRKICEKEIDPSPSSLANNNDSTTTDDLTNYRDCNDLGQHNSQREQPINTIPKFYSKQLSSSKLQAVRAKNNAIKKKAFLEPIILHPFAVYAPTSITIDDIVRTASTFAPGVTPMITSTPTPDQSFQLLQSPPLGSSGPTTSPQPNQPETRPLHSQGSHSLHIPLIKMSSVKIISVWGRVQQRHSIISDLSQLEPEPIGVDTDQSNNVEAIDDTNITQSPPTSPNHTQQKFQRQKPSNYINATTGKVYNMSLYPGFKQKFEQAKKSLKSPTADTSQSDTNPDSNHIKNLELIPQNLQSNPGQTIASTQSASSLCRFQPLLVQPNPKTTIIGNKSTLTSILARFTMYFSNRMRANTKPVRQIAADSHTQDPTTISPVQSSQIKSPTVNPNINDHLTLDNEKNNHVDVDNTHPKNPGDNTAYSWYPETYCLPQAYPLYLLRLMYEQDYYGALLMEEKQGEEEAVNEESQCGLKPLPKSHFFPNLLTATTSPSSWILKPSTGSCGRGIQVKSHDETITELINKTNNSLVEPNSTNSSDSSSYRQVVKFQDLITPQVLLLAANILRNPISAPFFIHPSLLLTLDQYVTLKLKDTNQSSIPEAMNENETTQQNTKISLPWVNGPPTSNAIPCPWCTQPNQRYVISAYISPPFLIKDRKFDLRVYVSVSSLSPLVAWIHRLALVRICTEPYELGTDNMASQLILDQKGDGKDWDELKQSTPQSTLAQIEMTEMQSIVNKKATRLGQLTNFSLNKFNPSFLVEELNDFDGSIDLNNLEIQQYYNSRITDVFRHHQTVTRDGDRDKDCTSDEQQQQQQLHIATQTELYSQIYGKATLSRLFKMMRNPWDASTQQNIVPESLFTNITLLVTRTLLAIKSDPKLIKLHHQTSGEKKDFSNIDQHTLFNTLDPTERGEPISLLVKPQYDPYSTDASFKAPSAAISLLGFDVMVDHLGQCWLAEVNTAPSLDCDADLDTHTKTAVVQQCTQLNGIGTSVLNQFKIRNALREAIGGNTDTKKRSPTGPELLLLPPSLWPPHYLQHLVAIELQSLSAQGFRRVTPSVVDSSNEPLLIKPATLSLLSQSHKHSSAQHHHYDPIHPSVVDRFDEMVQIWKLHSENDCIAALNQFISEYLPLTRTTNCEETTKTAAFPLISSSIHNNHCDDVFHPFQPHRHLLE